MAKGGPRLARRTRRAGPRGWGAVRDPPRSSQQLRRRQGHPLLARARDTCRSDTGAHDGRSPLKAG
eukprot:2083048-Prymnesium_polylepis.1